MGGNRATLLQWPHASSLVIVSAHFKYLWLRISALQRSTEGQSAPHITARDQGGRTSLRARGHRAAPWAVMPHVLLAFHGGGSWNHNQHNTSNREGARTRQGHFRTGPGSTRAHACRVENHGETSIYGTVGQHRLPTSRGICQSVGPARG